MAPASPALDALVPHRGAMCLLDAVAAHGADRIVCVATSHRAPDNPLRVGGRLPALAAIEYAAQAMAAHGSLTGALHAAPGRLVAVRDVRLHAQTLDDVPGDLAVEATRIASDAGGVVYAFAVSAGARLLAEGRATVMLREAPRT